MDFRLELHIKPFANQIMLQDKILLVGSCFTNHISNRLAAHKFQVVENPHGILFNVKSIETAISAYAQNKQYQKEDLFFFNDLFFCWDHHGQYAHPNASKALQQMNHSANAAHSFLQQAKWVIITIGSSWVYEVKNEHSSGGTKQVAANCHKLPQDHFNHRLLSAKEINVSLQNTVDFIRLLNPNAHIIFTISPVRHHREGMVENNRSKALLITAVHQLIEQNTSAFYFPSYELVIDDLRDYRFFAEDLVHPNHQATQYVWQKFVDSFMNENTKKTMAELHQITLAANHKPLHPQSKMHSQFLEKMLDKTKALQHQLPFIDLYPEVAYFENSLQALQPFNGL